MSTFRKILIVDDQASIHDAFREVLTPRTRDTSTLDALETLLFDAPIQNDSEIELTTFQLEHASQGAEGLEKVREACAARAPFGMAFVDMRMPPGWDGVETIQRLWEVDPELQVVVCTAHSDHVWNDVCRKLGRVDQLLLLNKPFATDLVLSLAHALTAKRQIMENLRIELANAQEANRRLAQEITSRKDAEKSLIEMATCDSLTGLPNRSVLNRLLKEFNGRIHDGIHRRAALLFLDLDNFKLVNDSFGHRAGDELLIEIASRLRSCIDAVRATLPQLSATIHRLGGDEFVVLIDQVDSIDQAMMIGSRINDALQPACYIRNRPVAISASIGITMIDGPVADEDDVLRKADTAMYRAKSDGKNRCAVFDDEMHRRVLDQIEIEHGLRGALVKNEFELHYQPIVRLDGRKTIGFEALIRWRTSEGKLIPPDRFIPFAEESRLIIPMGRWIAEHACQDFAEWKRKFRDTDECSISINVSKLQLVEPNYVDELLTICADSGLRPRDVNIEVTESTVIGSTTEVVENLGLLRRYGFGIHMDDFGTGHSSLSLLHRFPIDVLKIDRSFVATMENDIEYSTVIQAIITLAKNLDIHVTAEGIENERQVKMLLALGCDHGQGYFFAKPAPAEQAFARRSEIYCVEALEAVEELTPAASF